MAKKKSSTKKSSSSRGVSALENFRNEFNKALPKSSDKTKISKKAIKKASK